MKKIIGSVKKVDCPDGIERYFTVRSSIEKRSELGERILRGSIIVYRDKGYLTVTGDAKSLGCGHYEFTPDESLKHGLVFNNLEASLS